MISLFLISCNSTKENENLKMPEKLLGVILQYTYSEGNEYAVKFEAEGVSYQYRSGRSPEVWFGKFPYNHMITESNEHFVSWHEADKGDYVTLLINFDTNTLYGSAILSAKKVHFQKAEISKITKP
ncbi:MAG: hypothetical protein GQ574_01250 [Crocinitomix sp.]|nr:hypothetical protein [Crocinitomix sp.]